MSYTERTIKTFDAADISGNVTGSTISVSQVYGFSVYVSTTGSAAGTIHIDASVNGTDFFSIDTGAVSGATTLDFNKPDMMYSDIRIRYVTTSGTGSADAWVHLKG